MTLTEDKLEQVTYDNWVTTISQTFRIIRKALFFIWCADMCSRGIYSTLLSCYSTQELNAVNVRLLNQLSGVAVKLQEHAEVEEGVRQVFFLAIFSIFLFSITPWTDFLAWHQSTTVKNRVK